MLGSNRVVVTGMGVIAPNGVGVDAFWRSLLAGQSGIGPITQFDASEFPVQVAGEVRNFDLANYANGHLKRVRLGRHTQFALAAVQMALDQAGVGERLLGRCAPVPIVVGVSTSAFDIIERGKERLARGGPRRVSSYLVAASQPHAIAGALTESLGVPTNTTTLSSACPAGLQAVAHAAALVATGQSELAVSGGTDASITPLAVAGFGTAGMVPQGLLDPSTVSRPFDRLRSGGILSEGACMMVLENLEHARARGVAPLLEIVGYGTSVDPVGARPGAALDRSMLLALANARRPPRAVDYICAHGPSDPLLDYMETQAIKAALGDHAYRIPVTSIKGATGNPLSAAGPLQLAACALAFQSGLVPPTTNYSEPDPLCDLDYVPGSPRHVSLGTALINVHGLGGGNNTMAVGRAEP